MATIQSARAKYDRKMAGARSAYDASKGRAKANWATGMSNFLGGPVAGHIAAAYSAGIDAAQYNPTPAWGDKWQANIVAKMRGG